MIADIWLRCSFDCCIDRGRSAGVR